jgi:uncharacterized membrane protein
MSRRFAPYILALLAVIGFGDSVYLTIEHYSNKIPPCTIVHGCEVVLTSSYATIFSVPVALLGALYYGFIFLVLFLYFSTPNEKLLRALAGFTIVGLVVSGWFFYVQVALLHTFCQFCLLSAVTSTLLFVTGLTILLRKKPSSSPPPETVPSDDNKKTS